MPEFTRMVEPEDARFDHTVFASVRSISDTSARLSLGSIADKGTVSEIITPSEAKALWVVLGNYLAWAEGAGVKIDPNAPVGLRPLNSQPGDES